MAPEKSSDKDKDEKAPKDKKEKKDMKDKGKEVKVEVMVADKDKKKRAKDRKRARDLGVTAAMLDGSTSKGGKEGRRLAKAEEEEAAGKGKRIGKDLPKVEGKDDEEAAPLLCPDCGTELKDGARKCPNCGAALAEGEEIVCAVCGSVIEDGLDVCLICGTKLILKDRPVKEGEPLVEDFVHHGRKEKRPVVAIGAEEEKEKKARPAPPKRKAPAKKGKRKGKRAKRRVGAPRPVRGMANPAIVPVIATIILLLLMLAFLVSPFAKGIEIDGDFSDWEDVTMHEDAAEASLPDAVAIDAYAVETDDEAGKLNLYLRTKGKMFPGGVDDPNHVNVFIDADGVPDTGYLMNSIGADYRIEVKGWDGKVRSAKYFSFGHHDDPFDWDAFVETGNIQAEGKGKELELSKGLSNLGLTESSRPAILFTVKDMKGNLDISQAPIGLEPGGIAVTQTIKTQTTNIVPGSEGQVVMTLEVEAKGRGDTFKSIRLSRLGSGTVGDVAQVSLWSGDLKVDDASFSDVAGKDNQVLSLEPNLPVKVGKPVLLTLKMDVWDKAGGRTLGVMVLSSGDLDFENGPAALYTVQDGALRSYINTTPANPTVDGAFGEWTSSNSKEMTLPGGSAYGDIDLTSLKYRVLMDGQIRIMLGVRGTMLAGEPLPEYETPEGTCGPGPRCPDSGEAVIMVYIDADSNATTGRQVGSVGAEYAVVIHGKYGLVDGGSLGFYDYDSGKGTWEQVSAVGVSAYTDLHRAEIDIDFTKSGLTKAGSDHRYQVELLDPWHHSTLSPVME